MSQQAASCEAKTGGNFPGGSLMGGNFPGGDFPRTDWIAEKWKGFMGGTNKEMTK